MCSIIPTAHNSDSPLCRQPITPTAHYSDNPLFRQPIFPTANNLAQQRIFFMTLELFPLHWMWLPCSELTKSNTTNLCNLVLQQSDMQKLRTLIVRRPSLGKYKWALSTLYVISSFCIQIVAIAQYPKRLPEGMWHSFYFYLTMCIVGLMEIFRIWHTMY
jgi:hypothetical protein